MNKYTPKNWMDWMDKRAFDSEGNEGIVQDVRNLHQQVKINDEWHPMSECYIEKIINPDQQKIDFNGENND